MKVAVVTVGKEILTGKTVNTNLKHIALQLQTIGVEINRSFVIDDVRDEYTKILDYVEEDCIIFTGGLGPTIDDITRETVLSYFGVKTHIDEVVLSEIKEYFERMNATMKDTNQKQALVPDDGIVLKNNLGTAPGLYFKIDNKRIVLLPGPPIELIPMLDEWIQILRNELDVTYYSSGFKLVGTGESYMESKLAGFYEQHPTVNIAPYASVTEIKYVFTSLYQKDVEQCMAAFYDQFKQFIYGSLDDTLEEVVVRKLKEKHQTIGFAESCTGGLIASTIVNVSGSSDVFYESFVTYSNASKMSRLHVKEETLKQFGAVSEECAKEMVLGLQQATNADVCLSVTGIAGPTGGSIEKPVGLVYFGILYQGKVTTYRKVFNGNREMIRLRATTFALNMVRKTLED